jgi:lipoprotein LprG
MRNLSLLVAASVLLFVLACGGGGSRAAGDAPSAQQIVTSAARATSALKSFHFKLNHENGSTPMPLNLQLISAEGDVNVPDKLSADVKAKALGVTASVKTIGIGSQTWITNPFNRQWQQLPGVSVADITDPTALVNSMLASLKDPSLAGQSEVDGVKTYHVDGKMDASAFRAAFPSAQAGKTVDVSMWIGSEDYLPRKARIDGPLSDSEPKDIVREIELSRFNSAVDISPPK